MVVKSKGYMLVPRLVPTRQRSSFYKEIVTDFMASREKSVAVEGTDRKAVTLVQGLRKVLEADGIATIRVMQRDGAVYLTKE
ncbi:MAG TPA: hypothetical protein VIL51_06765 [Thermoleophilia bacterium]